MPTGIQHELAAQDRIIRGGGATVARGGFAPQQGPDAFDQCALRNEFDGHPALEHLLLGHRIEADMARDRANDHAGIDQLADATPRKSVVVRDHREITFVLPHEFIDDPFRSPDTHEAAYHQGGAIRDSSYGFSCRNGFHRTSNSGAGHRLPRRSRRGQHAAISSSGI